MIRRKHKEPKPFPTKGGHVSGDGSFQDAPRPPAMPAQSHGQEPPSCECGRPICGGSR